MERSGGSPSRQRQGPRAKNVRQERLWHLRGEEKMQMWKQGGRGGRGGQRRAGRAGPRKATPTSLGLILRAESY